MDCWARVGSSSNPFSHFPCKSFPIKDAMILEKSFMQNGSRIEILGLYLQALLFYWNEWWTSTCLLSIWRKWEVQRAQTFFVQTFPPSKFAKLEESCPGEKWEEVEERCLWSLSRTPWPDLTIPRLTTCSKDILQGLSSHPRLRVPTWVSAAMQDLEQVSLNILTSITARQTHKGP